MPLQSDGPLSLNNIGSALGATPPFSLRNLSAAAGKSTPDAISEFYGYGTSTGPVYTIFAGLVYIGNPCLKPQRTGSVVTDQNGAFYLLEDGVYTAITDGTSFYVNPQYTQSSETGIIEWTYWLLVIDKKNGSYVNEKPYQFKCGPIKYIHPLDSIWPNNYYAGSNVYIGDPCNLNVVSVLQGDDGGIYYYDMRDYNWIPLEYTLVYESTSDIEQNGEWEYNTYGIDDKYSGLNYTGSLMLPCPPKLYYVPTK